MVIVYKNVVLSVTGSADDVAEAAFFTAQLMLLLKLLYYFVDVPTIVLFC